MAENVISIIKDLANKSVEETTKNFLTDEFLDQLLDDAQKRNFTIEQTRSFVIGAAFAIGFYNKELKRGSR